MITYEGERVTLTAGSPGLYTIGVSLGRIVRFCGHTQDWYSVLCHSFVVAGLLPDEKKVYGLMHDAHECLTSDTPTPMKSQVARNRQFNLQKRIAIANGLMWPESEEIVEAVEEADHKALLAEAHILQHPGREGIWGTEFDAEAGKLTKKYLKKAPEYMNPAKSGPAFVKAFNKYAKLAGLNDPGEWE